MAYAYWPVWGAPLMGALLGWLGGYSATIIFMVTLGAFALVAFGLNNITQWIARRSAADKVRFMVPVIGVNMESENPPVLRGIKLGVTLQSRAQFPMEIRIDELETRIGDRVPAEDFAQRTLIVNGPGTGAQFTNSLINLRDMDLRDKLIYGRIGARVSYGRPGRLNYGADYNVHIAFKFDEAGNFLRAEPSHTEFTQTTGASEGRASE